VADRSFPPSFMTEICRGLRQWKLWGWCGLEIYLAGLNTRRRVRIPHPTL
jgi:hypothetical protein